jgi:transcription elongation factor S-II
MSADGGSLQKKLSASKTIDKGAGGSAVAKKRSRDGASPTSLAKAVCNDPVREKVQNLLSDALHRPDDGIVASKDDAKAVAVQIEDAMFAEFGCISQDYKMKARELKFNFLDEKNKDLREEVLGGSLRPAELVKMTSKDLANADMKAERQKLHKHFLREAAAGNKPVATTNEFRCGKCKKRECTYYQMQTRSADEPLTTFVQCVACGNRWRF